jgi:hypothetical protein
MARKQQPETFQQAAARLGAPATPVKKTNARNGCLGFVVLVVIIAVIVSAVSGSGGSGNAPSSFTVSDGAVVALVKNVINNTGSSPGLQGAPQANCSGETQCDIKYTVKEPTGISTDLELIQPTAQIWKGLFEDSNFQNGTIEVDGPLTSVGGISSNGPLFTLSCDRNAASQINWDNVDGNGLRTLCQYTKHVKGL